MQGLAFRLRILFSQCPLAPMKQDRYVFWGKF